MHILQLANFYGSKSGGLRVALDELAAQYLAAGHRVTTLVAGDANRRKVDAAGRTLLELRAAPLPGRMGGYRMIINPRTVERIIDLIEPDVIELSDKTTLAAAATRRKGDRPPVVLISHERLDEVVGQAFSRRPMVRVAVQAFNNAIGDRVDVVVCCSKFAAQEYKAGMDTPLRRIPLGVDLDLFRPGPNPANDRPQVVTVVRLTVDKDPFVLVDACRALVEQGVDHDWVVFGDGPLRARLEAQARDLPMRFMGHEMDRRLLAARIAQADVGVSPGPCETFGLAALELLACGTPVVVPIEGALPELVAAEVGRAVERRGDAFADAVQQLLSVDPAVQRSTARAHAERFSWHETSRRFLELYEELITRRFVEFERGVVAA